MLSLEFGNLEAGFRLLLRLRVIAGKQAGCSHKDAKAQSKPSIGIVRIASQETLSRQFDD